MPVKPKSNTLSFTEKYYGDKLNEKRVELFKHLERNPNDLVAKEQFQHVDKVLREGEKSNNFSWTNAWRGYEEAQFLSKSRDKWQEEKEK